MNDINLLPTIPYRIYNNENCCELLTDRNNNDWLFLFEELKDIPNSIAENQNYDFDSIAGDRWQGVTVPSSLVMQGFNIENNTEYYYKKAVKIPKEYKNGRVFLRFEGVYSNARIWINNRFCASHIGGFTAWDIEITEFCGADEITLVVGVSDIEGDKKGVWNPNGIYQSNSAWASYYAHHNIGGIIRDITMYRLPQKAILQTHIDTFITDCESTAKINYFLSAEAIGLTLKADVLRNSKSAAAKEADVTSQNVLLDLKVMLADLWDAEHPNLYTLKTYLCDGEKIVQENSINFGFREITYGGKNGTDKNRIYVNGREIKLRGVCRHDVSRLYGRSLTKQDIYNEIKTYKEHNINHIRTSHYPASDYMLEVCDELGMYVEQENAACFKGANGYDIYNPPEDFLNSFKEMIEFSRNHPSVIIWSIANESGFEKSSGFRACYNYVKKTDITRPVIFSYPQTVKSKPLPYDIFSKHYAKVTSNLGKSDIPVLHDEFAHVPCYNTDDLAYDNSSRVFWGESIKKGWDNIFNTSGALGCDIWAAVDDVFYLPSKGMEKHQNHLKGECAGYGEWGCVFDAFKRLKPEAYLTKKAFSPINILNADILDDEIKLTVQNRFDHTNLNEVLITVKDGNSNVIYSGLIKECAEPHEKGTVSIGPINCSQNMQAEFSFNGITVESVLLNKSYATLEISRLPIKVACVESGILIYASNSQQARINSMHLFVGEKKFSLLHSRLIKIGENKYSADFGFGRAFVLCVETKTDCITLKVKPKNKASSLYRIGEVGVDIEVNDKFNSVSFVRNSLYDSYPDGHIARNCSTAKLSGAEHKYGEKDISHISWEQDMSAFAYYEKSNAASRLASNDFRTKRLSVKQYLVRFESGKSILINTKSENVNAYANPFENKISISKGHYKPSILWGNYWGERFGLSDKNTFEFDVSFGN